jgi:hypothetical protein
MKFPTVKFLAWSSLLLVTYAKPGGDYSCHHHEGERKCGMSFYFGFLKYQNSVPKKMNITDTKASRETHCIRTHGTQSLPWWSMEGPKLPIWM